MTMPNHRDPVAVLGIFKLALEDFFQEDPPFHSDTCERALAFCLGIHLNNRFSDINVDAEYNMNEGVSKRIHNLFEVRLDQEDRDFLDDAMPTITSYNKVPGPGRSTIADAFFPDLIVHRRLENHHNVLALEIKKRGNRKLNDYHHDLKKLSQLTSIREPPYNYRYTLGIFLYLDLSSEKRANFIVFVDGKINQDLTDWLLPDSLKAEINRATLRRQRSNTC